MTLEERRGVDTTVYGPAEDSYLLAATVADDLAASGADERRSPASAVVLEVGTGSGFVAERIAEATGARVIGSDVNPNACKRARERGVEAVRGDLVAPFADGAFEAVVFNPPYLPTDPDASWDDWFEVAVTGGETGREVVERFLDDVRRVLAPGGAVYLLVSTYTDVEAVVAYAADRGFHAVALADASYPGETLTVLKLVE